MIPTQTVPRVTTPPAPLLDVNISQINEQLLESKQIIKDVKYENKLLKLKLDRRDTRLEKVNNRKIDESLEEKDKVTIKNLKGEKTALQKDLVKKNTEITQLEKSNESVSEHLVSVSFLKATKAEVKTATEKLQDVETDIDNDYLLNLLHENATVFTKDDKNSFLPDMIECIMNLLSCNV